jgi:hypothetical protein
VAALDLQRQFVDGGDAAETLGDTVETEDDLSH